MVLQKETELVRAKNPSPAMFSSLRLWLWLPGSQSRSESSLFLVRMQNQWLIKPRATYTLLLPSTPRSAKDRTQPCYRKGRKPGEGPHQQGKELPRPPGEKREGSRDAELEGVGKETPEAHLLAFCRTLSHTGVPLFPGPILHSTARGRGKLEKWQSCVLMERRHCLGL